MAVPIKSRRNRYSNQCRSNTSVQHKGECSEMTCTHKTFTAIRKVNFSKLFKKLNFKVNDFKKTSIETDGIDTPATAQTSVDLLETVKIDLFCVLRDSLTPNTKFR